jgi:F0F1-type ATP synthase delta subunit
MEKAYVQAVVELLAAGSDIETVLAKLRTVLVARGHGKALPTVLRGIVRALEEKADATATVIVAKASDAAALKNEIAQALTALGADNTTVLTTVDDTIIGGLIATYNHRQIDASYRTKLHSLYQQIVTN